MQNLRLAEIPAQQEELKALVERALEEDVGSGDLTTALLIPAAVQVQAHIVAKQSGVIAGGPVVTRVLHAVDPSIAVRQTREDGAWAGAGDTALEISGRAQAILTAERVCLNFLARLSGIATLTRQCVEAVARWDVKILDTRKTSPTLRLLERYAVRAGGGENHRAGLYDQVLVKDNHHRVLERLPQGTLAQRVKEFRRTHPGILVEIEVDSLHALEDVMAAEPDIVLLDNMEPDAVTEGVRRIAKRALTEVSGGMNLANIAEYARTGVDRISLGALTHSAPSIDFSLEIVSPKEPQ